LLKTHIPVCQVSATLIGAGTSSLVAVKVKGDANVPSGKTTWRTTRGLPEVGGPSLPAEIQVRANAKDPKGFSWVPGSLVLASEAEIRLTLQLGPFRKTGAFHKHKVGEEGGPS
jgi:hypothetical protein